MWPISLFHSDAFPSWGFSIKHGATSIWERWDGWTPEKGFQDPGMNSFAHYSFGAVGEWMFKTIGGIDSDGPAYDHIVIHPQPGGHLTWAKTTYNSIHGPIATDLADHARFTAEPRSSGSTSPSRPIRRRPCTSRPRTPPTSPKEEGSPPKPQACVSSRCRTAPPSSKSAAAPIILSRNCRSPALDRINNDLP